MQTTTYAKLAKGKINKFELDKFKSLLHFTVSKVKKYVKGHTIIIEPMIIDKHSEVYLDNFTSFNK